MKLPVAVRRPGKRTLAVGALGLAAVAATIAALGGGEGEPAEAQDPGVPTVALERRDLASRESVEGTLGYAGEAEVINRMSGTITWLPAEGDLIGRGKRLYEVDGEPVLLMFGDVPAYRDLSSGVSDGPDVEQLESNLARLGFDPSTVDDEFTSTTASAVSDWQDSVGLDETGSVELGRVVFMAGTRRVMSLELALGSDADSAAGAGTDASSTAGTEVPTVLASYVASAGTTSAGDERGDATKKEPSKKPAAKKPSGGSGEAGQGAAEEPAEQAAPSISSESADPSATDSSNPSTPVMTTSSERRVVTVQLDPSDVALAKRGQPARVSLPDGKEVKGRIATVGTVAQAADDATTEEGSSDETTIEVTISLPEGAKVTALDQAPVTVELTDEVRRDVFAVPVEALLGTAGDEYAIVLNDSQGRRQVAVTPGLFADGYVEVEGDGLGEGAQVEVPGE